MRLLPFSLSLSFSLSFSLSLSLKSQVSFWLIKTDMGHETAARTGLGATSTLAVVTIGFGGKTKPQVMLIITTASSYFKRYHYCHHHYQVAYATALDIFIIICFISVFCALAEFALLSFLDLYIRCIAAMCRSVSQHDGMCDG